MESRILRASWQAKDCWSDYWQSFHRYIGSRLLRTGPKGIRVTFGNILWDRIDFCDLMNREKFPDD